MISRNDQGNMFGTNREYLKSLKYAIIDLPIARNIVEAIIDLPIARNIVEDVLARNTQGLHSIHTAVVIAYDETRRKLY